MTADSSTSPNSSSLDQLTQRAVELEQQLADEKSKYLRSLADFQNFQRRAALNEHEARSQARAQVVQSLLGVLDNFDLALKVDTAQATAEQVLQGVTVIKEDLLRVLQSHGVGLINPEPGDAFDPNIHQAVVQREADDVDPGHIVQTLQPGYTISTTLPGGPKQERVVRPAMVAVKPS
ncbi:MAG: hypothetical protein AMXMBFR58_32790 [Phycisphaerae bacterium]|nr:Protein GrpE [Phycisphaerales bacterium]MCK6475978.1 nucleotide exchange factor GrpE [Phycisphaerales bacterium]